jgi:hypothetical protein
MKRIIDDEKFKIKPTNPLLLCVDEKEYQIADLRVMFFGQETNSWNYLFSNDMQLSIGCYNQFYNKEECWEYGGQFWNGVRRFARLLKEKFYQRNIQFIWNNVIKIGKETMGRPPEYIYKVEREFLPVIKDEIRILKPNVILFLTGPNYDDVLADNFGQLNYESFSSYSKRQLSRFELLEVKNTFRTYHPNYLWRNDIDSFFETIINEIYF